MNSKNEGGQKKSINMNYYVMFYKKICVQNVQNKSCGHLIKAWQAIKCPRALGWTPLFQTVDVLGQKVDVLVVDVLEVDVLEVDVLEVDQMG